MLSRGRAVRDVVMGKEPKDYDSFTDALPDEMLNIFPKSVSVGAKFGTVMALVQDGKGGNSRSRSYYF